MLIILGFGLLQACSAVRLAYNQAPDLAYWWLDGYVDFNETQSPRVRDELTRLMAWHRTSELPKYVALLQKAQLMLPKDTTAREVCALFDETRTLFDSVSNKALPVMAEFAPTLTTEQLSHLKRKYAKNNEEYAKERLKGTAQERAARRLKQAVERSEMLYGKLDEVQISAVKLAIEQSSFDVVLNQKERERRQKDALDTLSGLSAFKPAPQASLAALRAYVERSAKSPDLTYRTYADKIVQESCTAFTTVHASTTSAQRTKAVENLQDYVVDMQALIKQK